MAVRHILIIDDDEALRTVLAELFRVEGYVVQVAGNGSQALKAMASDDFDVLLTDVAMPVMDGRELTRTLRDKGIHVPVVAMTAKRSISTVAREMGAAAYVQKPFDVEDLLETVDRVVQQTTTNSA